MLRTSVLLLVAGGLAMSARGAEGGSVSGLAAPQGAARFLKAAVKPVSPTAPSGLRVANVWETHLDLNWDDRATNEAEYLVAMSRDGGASWDNVGRVGANAVAFRVQGLKAGRAYLFKVRASNAAGFSAYSGTVSVTTRPATPRAPVGLATANVWASRVDLAWVDRASDESAYHVAISRDGGATWENVAALPANSKSFRMEGLRPGTRYQFKVRAANAAGFSDYTSVLSVVTRR